MKYGSMEVNNGKLYFNENNSVSTGKSSYKYPCNKDIFTVTW